MSRTLGAAKRPRGRPVELPENLDWGSMPPVEHVAFGGELMSWRLSVGLSRQSLGKVAGISHDTLKRIERGGPMSERMAQLLKALRAGGPAAAKARKIQQVVEK